MGTANFQKPNRAQGDICYGPSLKNFPVMACMLSAAFLVAILSSMLAPWSLQTIELPLLPRMHVPLFGIIPLILGAKLTHDLRDSKLILFKDYVLFATGLMSWKEHTVRIRYNHIREIEINQTLLQKLFGTGDIVLISMSSQSEDEIDMKGVSNPRAIKDLIESKRNIPGSTDLAAARDE